MFRYIFAFFALISAANAASYNFGEHPIQTALTDGGTIAVNALGNGSSLALTVTLTASGHVIANPTNVTVGQQIDFLINAGSGPFFLGTSNGNANGWGVGYTWATGSVAIIGQIASTVTEVKCTVIATTPTLLCYGPVNSAMNQVTAATPAAPNAAAGTYTMQGLALSLTPATTGNIVFDFNATINMTVATINFGISWKCSNGTGTVPTSNQAVTGTQGLVETYTNPIGTFTAADINIPAHCTGMITGATAGTPVWMDVAATLVGGTGGKFVNATMTAWEVR